MGTGELIYNRDVNGMAYFNANLPAAQASYAGVDNRPHWVGDACKTTGQPGGCVNRINNDVGNQIVENIVLANQGIGRSLTFATSLTKPLTHGFTMKAAYSYGRSKNTVDPGSIAAGSWTNNAIVADPNNPELGFSQNSPGHRFFIAPSYTRQYFGLGATTIGAFFDVYTGGNTSYIFSGDANGDNATANDLIYIPRDASEMNFQTFTSGGKTFTAADQAAAFESYIQQDDYLSSHRGQYAERGAVFYPLIKRLDLSITQDVFHSFGGMRHSGQIRLDITNFGNLLNHDWGVSQSIIQNRILNTPSTDAQGRLTYRLATVSGANGTELISHTFKTNAAISDVYVMMLSFRYTFQ